MQLPKDLFYGAMIPASILVCNHAKPVERAGRVLLIDASTGFVRRDTKNVLTAAVIERVAAIYKSGEAEAGFAVWATREQIAAQDYNLTVRRYVRAKLDDQLLDLAAAAANLRRAIEASHLADERVLALLDDGQVVR